MKKIIIILLLVVVGGVTTGSCWAQDVQSLNRTYLDAMVNYRGEIAQFNRNKQLYLQNQSDSNMNDVMASARATFVARQKAAIDFTAYLHAVLGTYVTTDQGAVSKLSGQLNQESGALAALDNNFSTITNWYQADTNFSNAYANLNETAYQSFAQIYWHELNNIIENYVTLYQNQNQRILSEAVSQIEREKKRVVLEETERALNIFQQRSKTLQTEVLSTIDSRDKYVEFQNSLNLLLADVETSLKTYAGLE